MLDDILHRIKKYIPKRIFGFFQPAYHFLLALCAAVLYGFPSRKLHVVAITGTKGKTTTAELLFAIWKAAGYTAALSSTIRFVVVNEKTRNQTKMALPGRFFLQRFLWQAEQAGCTHVVVEVSSEAAKQFRHRFVLWDGLIFTNLAPEHIESHGSFEKYKQAKLSIARSAAHSNKQKRVLVANADDPAYADFADFPFTHKAGFSLTNIQGKGTASASGKHGDKNTFTFQGEEIQLNIPGVFNIENALAAATYAQMQNIPLPSIKEGLQSVEGVPGRMQYIQKGQPFDVIIDYAHTKESLEYVHNTLEKKRHICVLGGTGGGRDTEKRAQMGRVSDEHCTRIILTNEDPYDEDPEQIVRDVAKGITETPVETILDRRAAIARALEHAKPGDVVLITGKGTDPFIMGPDNTKERWSDAEVAEKEIIKLLEHK